MACDPEEMIVYAEVAKERGLLIIQLCTPDSYPIDTAEVALRDIIEGAKNPPQFTNG